MSLMQDLGCKRLYMDGAMGTMLQKAGLPIGGLPERWGMQHKDVVVDIHRSYFDAGANIVCTNTFGANSLKYSDEELEAIIHASVEAAREAASLSCGKQDKYIALDIGPLGRLLKPYGDLDFEEAVAIFAKTVRCGIACGVDLIVIETMNDSYETKAAVLAAKECCDLPVFATNAYGADGKLMTGGSPAAMVAMLDGLGVAALGANCSLGPEQLIPIIDELLTYSSLPVIVKPNAGMPIIKDGQTCYGVEPDEFAAIMRTMAEKGALIMGGCCGTSPAYIEALVKATADIEAQMPQFKKHTLISSYSHAVELNNIPKIIGERINPTGKKRFKQALVDNDIAYILQEGISQQEAGADILDVNVGLPNINEQKLLTKVTRELQAVLDLPLQIDTASPTAMEAALRIYNGKPMLNSVNGKQESMDAIFPLVKKYGGVVVALTMDESGIPDNAEARVAIAEKILRTAAEYGIDSKNIVFDTLCMAVSADADSAQTTLKALHTLSERGYKTVLGVSNISFGLPQRELLNANFFSLALENGLSSAIINPHSIEMQKSYRSFMLLHGLDADCLDYIKFASELPEQIAAANATTVKMDINEAKSELQNAIIKGLRDKSASACEALGDELTPMQIINEHIIPALDTVGKGFEQKTMYLPQLLMSAEAAKAAFEKVKLMILDKGEQQEQKGLCVLATVKGDIHDIGKNIVKVLLENYGFRVIDLGRDVDPEEVLEAVQEYQAPICGLSALMTTTVPAMADTVKLLHEKAPYCHVVVGGAVLNAEYAEDIHADRYSADAMETVRYAESICCK